LAVLLVAGVSSAGLAQQEMQTTKSAKSSKKVVMKEQHPGLLSKAKIPADSARKLATAKASGETLRREEIRQDNGKLVYTFWFKNEGKSGVDAIDVDAATGMVAEPRHESKSEARSERKGTNKTSGMQKKS
jgi:uncharacterized membrane protein YkoI